MQTALSDSARTRLGAALELMPIAGIGFLWFVGVVRDRVGSLEDHFSTVYLGRGCWSRPLASPAPRTGPSWRPGPHCADRRLVGD